MYIQVLEVFYNIFQTFLQKICTHFAINYAYDIISLMASNNRRFHEYAVVVFLGLLVAFGVTMFMYWRSQRQSTTIPSATPTPSPAPITELPDKPVEPLTIASPDNEAVFDSKTITVTGHTFPQLPVVIFINQKNFLVTSDENGDFSLDVNLDSGSNMIQVTSVDNQGQSFSAERLVVYTNKSLDEILLTDDEVKAADKADNN